MRIKVTKDHIDAGLCHDVEWCPVALALAEYGFDRPKVTYDYFTYHGEDLVINLPRKCSRFILRFDDGETVKPFEFEI